MPRDLIVKSLLTQPVKFMELEPRERVVIVGLPQRLSRMIRYFRGNEPIYFIPSNAYGTLCDAIFVGQRVTISEEVYQWFLRAQVPLTVLEER